MPQVKVGWRSGAVAAPSVSTMLLDVYSGASAAYSLRKLSSTYTGSAIRVRRSSDNTELNIGFDANGDLDTYALSAFVGSGNGFVTTWYDQSGSYNLIQTTAANQPSIVLSGVLNTQNSKPVLITDFNSFMTNGSLPLNGTTNSIFNVIKLTATRGAFAMMSGYSSYNQHWPSRDASGNNRYYDSGGSNITASPLPNGYNLINLHENASGITVYENNSNLVTNFAHDVISTTGIFIFRRDVFDGNYMPNGSGYSELVIYGSSSKLSDNSAISNNINTYYSVYPNPTSVWNLLAAAYNADATGSSSLKTSLFAAYNGESNANDSKGTNNGTAQGGLTYTTGKIGDAFNFNGTNSYVSLPDNSMNFTGDFTISVWIYPTAGTPQVILNNVAYSSGTIHKGWQLAINNISGAQSGKITFSINTTPTNSTDWQFTTTTLTNNSWNHVVIKRVSSVNTYCWVNGVSQAYSLSGVGANITTNPVYHTTQYVVIGAGKQLSGTVGAYLANGSKVDAVNVWQKALTQSEITELYNSGNGAQYIGDNFYKPTVNDALNTYNGTAQGGLTYGVGKVGTAFNFNGTTSYVKLPTNSFKFTSSDDFSISLWIWMTSPSQNTQFIFSNSSFDGTNQYGYYLYQSGGALLFRIGSSSGLVSLSTPVDLVDKWSHITITRKASTGTKMYINGTLATSNTNTQNPNYSATMIPSVGAGDWGSTYGVNYYCNSGTKIDTLNVWNKELSTSEITELYNSGNGKQYPN